MPRAVASAAAAARSVAFYVNSLGTHRFEIMSRSGASDIGWIGVNRSGPAEYEFFDASRPSGDRWRPVRGAEWNVEVDAQHRREGLGTKLYEAAAAEVRRRRGAFFSSDDIRSAQSQGFWTKQERNHRHRVIFVGSHYVMNLKAMPEQIDLGRAFAGLGRRR